MSRATRLLTGINHSIQRFEVLLDQRALAAAFLVLVPLAMLLLWRLGIPFDNSSPTQRILAASTSLSKFFHGGFDCRHPPLFFAVLHLFLKAGVTEWVARLPAVLFGLGSVWFTFLVFRPLVGTFRGLLLMICLSATFAFVEQSMEVANITMFVFLTLASTHVLFLSLKKGRVWALAAFVILETALLYTYYLAPLVVFSHMIAAALSAHPGRLRVWLSLVAVLFLSWVPINSLAESIVRDSGVRDAAGFFPLDIWGDYKAMEFLSQTVDYLFPEGVIRGLPLTLLVLGLARLLPSIRRNAVCSVTLILALTTPLVLPFGSSLVRLQPYYATFLMPFLLGAMMMAVNVPTFTETSPWLPFRGLLRIAGLAVSSTLVVVFVLDASVRMPALWEVESRDGFRKVGEFLKAQHPAVVATDHHGFQSLIVFYAFDDPLTMDQSCVHRVGLNRPSLDGLPVECRRGDEAFYVLSDMTRPKKGWEEASVRNLESLSTGPVWLVHPTRVVRNPTLTRYLERRCLLALTEDGIHVYRCDGSTAGKRPEEGCRWTVRGLLVSLCQS